MTLQELDRDRIHLFAGRTAGHPDPDRLPRVAALAQGREDPPPQRLEGVRIAEELGDADQEILVERGQLLRIAFDQRRSTPRGSRSLAAPCAAGDVAAACFACNA